MTYTITLFQKYVVKKTENHFRGLLIFPYLLGPNYFYQDIIHSDQKSGFGTVSFFQNILNLFFAIILFLQSIMILFINI